ncbi:ubiquitin carboxyl-terminal hydrolase 9Y isoform X6 [Gorilla gorilla gorilla]|uniref:ubiquitin carboxyl-terminal hydrolase 9Y isoform X6 n=1 Tax=Gorilla gorilla gorilla TaxID=9595 RepID=UPI002445B252|nr:probable ubiquitin carboxyl-terminal hydrolase FAF-Y isoform X7 [Gorilla gorilla gorilla]
MTAITRGSPVGGNDSQGQVLDGQSQHLFQQNQTSSPDSSNENSVATPPPEEQGQCDSPPQHEDEDPAFPHTELAKLDDMINRPRWVVPVLPKGELEVLLEAAIDLSVKGLDVKSEACQRFFRDGLTISFTKILMDEAVSGWKFEIHRCIINNTHRLVELCVAKLSQDWFPLLELLAMALNPHCKFHIYNGTRPCELISSNAQLPEDELFARSSDPRSPKGWLVDLINKFGILNGFQILHDRFFNGSALNVQIIAALIKPFGQCYEFLSQHTVKKYFIPVIEIVPHLLENLTDEELKKEAKNEAKNDALSMIIKSLKNLASRISGQDETIKNLEIFRLKMILRLLQISSFNGKMNALNEINKVISSVSYYTHRRSNPEEEEWLTAERMAEWIQQNNILSIVLQDSLHQPQYVEKLEKILRFVIKEKALTLQDLDNIWAAQAGKHEAIVKNVHDLLAKLAWDFSPGQLDHLFDCFKASWTNASKKQREKLLELIRRLAEDDKDGVMAHKVLNLLWNLAHSDDVPVDIMDLALSAHIKILDYSCSQDRDAQKIQWIDHFIEELRTNDKWVIPALKQIREICSLFGEAPQNLSQTQRSPHIFYRHDLINQLQQNHALVTLVAENLATYMNSIRLYAGDHEDYDPQTVRLGSRYSHVQEVQERLNFLRFLLKDGQLWLCAPQAKQIWKCLAENAVYLCDREACFKWYSKLMGDEPDLDPDINKDFFESNVLQLDPSLLTENGMKCFERFFKAVNCRERKLIAKRRSYMMDDLELIGLDYLWRVVIQSSDEIANRAIDLLKEIYTNLGPRLKANQVVIHEDFIQSCFDRLKASYDTLCVFDGDKNSINCARQEAIRMVRVLTVIKEYINECDSDYHKERMILPMSRAFRGKHLSLIVRFPNQGRQVDELDIWSHTNDTIGSVRRCIVNRIKANVAYTKIELFVGGELIDSEDDRKLIGQLNLKDKSLITAKLTQINSNMPSSPDSSSDSSTASPGNHRNHYNDGPNLEVESCLPGVIMSVHPRYISFLWQVADLGSRLNMPPLRDGARVLMKLVPPDRTAVEKLRAVCLDHAKLGEGKLSPPLDSLFFGPSASQVLYLTEVVYALLMPAGVPLTDGSSDFQVHFLKSGGLPLVLSMLIRSNFLPNTDTETRRGAYLNALKIAKLLLTAIGYGHVRALAEACQPVVDGTDPITPINQVTHDQAVVLQSALKSIPNPSSECILRNESILLAQQISNEASRYMPDICVIRAIQKIIWASACGALGLVFSPNEEITKIYQTTTNGSNKLEVEDEQVCCEALEVMTLCFALLPTALDALSKEKAWQTFIIDLLLHCPSKTVRQLAQEQFFLMCTRCCMGHRPLLFFITLLFTILGSTAREKGKYSGDYFTLLRHLLNYAYNGNINIPNAEVLLVSEIDWLKKIRDNVKNTGETGVEEPILEGHLGVTKELLAFQTSEKKYHFGCEKGGANLVKELIDDFIFPASKVYLQYLRSGELPAEQAIPVCSSPVTINAGFELLVALAIGCVRNLKQIVDCLTEMYYMGTAITTCEALTEWEYLPPVGPRPPKGFVGLKNAGATCYMNSVIQQLYMIPSIRNSILAIEGTGSDLDDDMFGDEKQDSESNVDPRDDVFGYPHQFEDKPALSKTEDRKEYNIGVLRHLQVIFGHLAASRLQYYVPRGFWKQFRLWGEPVNLREQHDALEFFNSLVDSLDEALKALGHPAILSKVLGGSFADQKICQGCPHRYECEESFTTLNVDIRNHQNLLDSLEQYIKGDLLEGANAYHCEKCDKKVDTVKRLLIKKLPRVLAIQLKRFDYDWERECAIKFNDYFEFPRELDMGPYTVAGQDYLLPEAEEITMISIQLAARFLFTTGFHTKKIVRGPASDWYDALCVLLRHSKNVRFWFTHNVLFNVSNRFSEYLLECPSAEVRGAFAKLIVFIAHFSLQDGSCPSPFASPGLSSQACDNLSLSDHLLRATLNLLRREVSEHGRHLQQYFNLFVMYANLGVAEKTQLLKLNVPATFMLVSLDEGPGPPIKYQYAELGKLYSVVSQLIRCCSVSSTMQSSINGNPPLPNPFGDPNLSQPIMPIQQNVSDILFVRTSYVKKIIEDCSNSEDTIKLLCFCSWENPQFSSTVLSELLWQVAYSYTYELRPYLDLLLQILLIEDSWQTHRIHNALKGIPDDRDGLFDTIQRSKNHYQKRAYQCIKCMVALFSSCPVAYQILQGNGDLKRKWTWAVEWLGDELERRPYTGNPQYSYNNWSPPVQSNETANGYFLERSHSARMTFAKACELCPEEEPDDQDAPDEHEHSPSEDAPLYPHSPASQYQQNNHVHGQPYTGPAAHHLNNPQKTGQRTQENYEGNEEVSSPQMKDQ